MNAHFTLKPQQIPTTERPEFKAAMVLAKGMGNRPSGMLVKAWAVAMKKALGK